ncbi:hypothetical protein ACFO3J_19560 [Streptomyces polygonati]|uniref:Sigma-like protein n=1 Tax=Streptomyces polygonati TaxID=1617087 RepID=A0ABV8HNT6_9ACTN
MSTEIPPTDPTDPLPPVPPGSTKDDPDNWHTEGTTQAPADGLLTGKPAKPAPVKPGTVKPDNWHTESEPSV